ncbi:hypothetical protein K402DRAFT_294982, partial [Aulographum hederae CBS 113979]
MLTQNLLVALAYASMVSALPLNINLGAYSPALVVGDGEISFGGAQSAGEIMETLASGAANSGRQGGAPAPGAGAGAGGEAPGAAQQPAPVPVAVEPAPAAAAVAAELLRREINGFREALRFAGNAMKDQPKVELGTGGEGSGVGITVNPGENVRAGTPAAG